MKKFLLLVVAFATVSLTAQVTIFEDGFEAHADFEIAAIGTWTQIDVDGNATYGSSGYDFVNESYTGTAIVFNPSATTNADGSGTPDSAVGSAWDVRTGAKGLFFVAATNSPNGTAANDDYMITPQIDLTGATSSAVSMWAKTLNDQWGNERFELLLSTTGTAVADFTVNLSGLVVDTPITYTEYTYDLSAYDGQQIYLAIHYLGTDTFVFQVDDFKVTAASVTATTDDNVLASSVSVYPTAVDQDFTINNRSTIALNTASIFDVNGRLIAQHNLNGLVGEKTINVSGLSAGLYFVELASDNGKAVKKLIKK